MKLEEGGNPRLITLGDSNRWRGSINLQVAHLKHLLDNNREEISHDAGSIL